MCIEIGYEMGKCNRSISVIHSVQLMEIIVSNIAWTLN